jgi:hypothetical protein
VNLLVLGLSQRKFFPCQLTLSHKKLRLCTCTMDEAGQVAALIVIGQKYCEEARTLWDKVVLFDVHKFEFNFLNVMLFRTSLP